MRPIILSMTTIPSRATVVDQTIHSLLEQTHHFDELRIYAPPGVHVAPRHRVMICPCLDHGPVTKMGAVCDNAVPNNALVVTVDDDILYAQDWLKTLIQGVERFPEEACGFAGWNVDGFLADPNGGDFVFVGAPQHCDVLEGFAGVAYQKRWFGPEILDPPDYARCVDDVWISAQLRRQGVVRRLIAAPLVTVTERPGLHTAADFKAKNRAAAVILFGPPAMKLASMATAPLLSICIPSLHQRSAELNKLLSQLRAQPRTGEVEILVLADDGKSPTGSKRNQLVAQARGKFVVHVDDDDQVAPNYISTILTAIESHPSTDVVLLRGRRITLNGKEPPLEFDYRLGGQEGVTEDGTLWRTPGHLCPIRTDIARRVLFPAVTWGEDLIWNQAITPYLRNAVRAGRPREILYHYQWTPKSTRSDTPMIDHVKIFTPQYRDHSGPGSTRKVTRPYRRFLGDFIRKHKIRSVLDLGCGDLEVMRRVDLHDAHYLGVDVIAARIEDNKHNHREHKYTRHKLRFEAADVRTYPIPKVDLVVMKDVLQHWNNEEVHAFLAQLRGSPAKMALLTNDNYDDLSYAERPNADCKSGTWRPLDLTASPFSIGEVVLVWHCPRGDHLDTKHTVMIKIK